MKNLILENKNWEEEANDNFIKAVHLQGGNFPIIRACCDSDRDMETGEMFCLTHQTKICAVCRIPVGDEEIKCRRCQEEMGK